MYCNMQDHNIKQSLAAWLICWIRQQIGAGRLLWLEGISMVWGTFPRKTDFLLRLVGTVLFGLGQVLRAGGVVQKNGWNVSIKL
jgi:hypothetical protein